VTPAEVSEPESCSTKPAARKTRAAEKGMERIASPPVWKTNMEM
jgi:hypothetical protein